MTITKENNKKINAKLVIAVLVFSAFIGTFNETILNVALNPIMNDFHINSGTAQWIITAYMLVTSVMVPITAFLYESFKTKKLYIMAMLFLLAGTVICAVAPSLIVLIAGRMIQAIGAGMLIPIMMSTVLLVSPKEKIGISMAICVSAITLGPAFGPTISGIILQFLDWNMLFVILIPIIIIAIILGAIFVENASELSKPKLDYLSVVLSMCGLVAFIYGISSIFNSFTIGIISFIVGLVLIAIFAKRQTKLKEPMLNLTPFKFVAFDFGVIMVMAIMMICFTMNVIIPLYLEGALHTGSFIAGLVLLPAILCNAVAAIFGGKILDKHGIKVLIPGGFLLTAISVFVLSRVGSSTQVITVAIIYILIQIGVGLTMSPSQTSGLRHLPRETYTHGVAIMTTFQQISACIGSSLFVGVMSFVEQQKLQLGVVSEKAVSQGFSAAVLVAFAIVIIGFISAIILIRMSSKDKAEKSIENTSNNYS